MPVERISSLDDSRLDVYRNLRQGNLIRDARLFIAEGPTVVERVLCSGYSVASVLISDRKWERFSAKIPPDICVYRVTQDLAEALVGYQFHCGVLASAVRHPAPPWQQIVPATGAALLLAGDHIVDPENVGAMIRIAAGFGAVGVILGPGSADPFSRRVLRVSMGNVLFLPVVQVADLAATLQCLQTECQMEVCSSMLDAQAVPLPRFEFASRSVLVLGNEYAGVSEPVAELSQHHLTIPMHNGTDSLNVAIAAGIFIWQYRQQHPV